MRTSPEDGVLSSAHAGGNHRRFSQDRRPLRCAPRHGDLGPGRRRARGGLSARDFIFTEGDQSSWFWLVRAGRIKLLRQSRDSKEVVVELLGPGEAFGGVATLEGRPYPASAQAMEPSTVVKFPRAKILALAERHPTLVREMTLMLSRRLRTAHDSVTSLASDPLEARLASRLIRLAESEGPRDEQGHVLPFHLTRQTLADMSGTTVETTIRVMKPMAQERHRERRRRSSRPPVTGSPSRDRRARSPVELERMPPLMRRYIKTSSAFLMAGVLLGIYVSVGQYLVGTSPPRLIITAHVHLLLVGFMLMIVMGMAT